jgi:ParB family chromosome partitioning protein
MIGNKFKGLGKGLSALMGDIPSENIQTKSSSEKIPIHFVYANPSQPRKNFNQELLNELSESIKEQEIIQPILVRKKSEDKYEIIAGERRWRAAQLAKIHEVPWLSTVTDDDFLTSTETPIITVGAATMPGSGKLVVDFYYSGQ